MSRSIATLAPCYDDAGHLETVSFHRSRLEFGRAAVLERHAVAPAAGVAYRDRAALAAILALTAGADVAVVPDLPGTIEALRPYLSGEIATVLPDRVIDPVQVDSFFFPDAVDRGVVAVTGRWASPYRPGAGVSEVAAWAEVADAQLAQLGADGLDRASAQARAQVLAPARPAAESIASIRQQLAARIAA